MGIDESTQYWWCAISLRIAHAELDPHVVTKELGISPSISLMPGMSKVRHSDSESAGYWCGGTRIDYPNRPSELIIWMESLVKENESFLRTVIGDGADVNVYLGIHLNAASIGFDVPITPIMNRLGIRIGIELFGR